MVVGEWVSSQPTFFLSYLFIHTQKKFTALFHVVFSDLEKISFFISAILKKELKLDKGAINLERQTHF